MAIFPRRRDGKRKAFKFSSDTKKPSDMTPDPWAPTAGPGQSIIGGQAVRTEGNPWGDADGGKGWIGHMASDAWKNSGY